MRGIKKEKTPYVRVEKDKKDKKLTDLSISNVDLLKQIAENTDKGNELLSQLGNIKNSKKEKRDSLKLQKPIEYRNKKVDLSVKKSKIDDIAVSIADNVQLITDYVTSENRLNDLSDEKTEPPVITSTDKNIGKSLVKSEKKEKPSKLDKVGLSKKSRIESVLTNISDSISQIVEILSEKLTAKEAKGKDITSLSKISRKNESGGTTSLTKVSRKVGGDSLKNIELYTFKILKHLEKGISKTSKKEKKAESQEIKITGLAKASKEFESIGSNIDKKALRGMKSFQRQIEQMTKPRFVKNIKGLNAVMHEFSTKINEIARQMSSCVVSLKDFIRLIGLAAISMVAPALEKGTKKFVDMFSNVNSKLAESKKSTGGATWKEMLVGLGIGITAVVGALLLVKFVDWNDIMKMLGFLAGLFGILSLFNLSRRGIAKKNVVKNIHRQIGGGTSIKGDNMLTAFAFGLAVLVIGLSAITEINWKGPLIMLGFITALYAAIIIGNKLSGGIGPNKGMFGTAAGIALLVLAAAAADEVFTKHLILDAFGLKLYGSPGTLGIIFFVLALGVGARIAGGGGFKGMLGFAIAIGILILCAEAAGEVFLKTEEKKIMGINWLGTVGTLGIIMFTYAMAGAIRYATGGKQKIGKYSVLYFVGAILSILFTIWAVTKLVEKYGFTTVMGGVLIVAGFTYGMSLIIRNINNQMKGIKKKQFLEKIGTMTIAMLMLAGSAVLVMWAISEINITWDRVLQFGLMILLMVGIFIAVNEYIDKRKMTPAKVEKVRNTLFQIALSFAVLSAPLYIISLIDITWEQIAKFGVAVIGMVAIFIGMNEYLERSKVSDKKINKTIFTLLKLAGAFVALSIPMVILSGVDVSWKTMAQIGAAVLGLGLVAVALGALESLVKKGTIMLMLLGVSFGIFSLSMMVLSGVDVSWETLAQMGVAILGLGLIAAALGIPVVAAFVGLGSAVLIVLGGALLVISFALSKISEYNISIKKVANFSASLGILVGAMALITPLAIIASLAVPPLAVISLAAIGISRALYSINKLDFKPKKMQDFVKAMQSLVKGITDVKIKHILEASVKAPMLTIIGLGAKSIATALWWVQNTGLKSGSISTFNESITSVVETFRNIKTDGIKEKVDSLQPVMAAAKDYAIAIQSLQDMTIDEAQTQAFCNSLSTFISAFDDEIQATVGKMDQMKPGLEALEKIVNLPKQLSEGITSIANMNFVEYENKNGQLVEKSKRKLTETEMVQAASNFGTMLSMLIDPIQKLGSAKTGDIVSLGNVSFKIADPLEQKAAYELIKAAGEAYQPFFDVTEAILDKAEVLCDNEKSQNIMNNFSNLIATLMTTSDKLKGYEMLTTDQTNRVKGFSDFASTIKLNTAFDKDLTKYNKNTYSFFDNVTKIMERMENSSVKSNSPKLDVINTFAEKINNMKWNTINDGLAKVNKNVEGIVKNINGLNLEKVVKLNDTLKFLSEDKTSNNIAQCIEKIDELIGTITTYQEKRENYEKAKIKSEEEAKALQQQIANNSGKTLDSSSLLAALKLWASGGIDVNAEINNTENTAVPIKVVQDRNGTPPNSFKKP